MANQRKIPEDFLANERADADYLKELEPKSSSSLWDYLIDVISDFFKTLFTELDLQFPSLPFGFFKIIFYILISVVLFLIIRALIKHNLSNSFKKRDVKIKMDENPEVIQDINLEELVKKSLKNKKYRDAIRYEFLFILQRMEEKKVIVWNKNKTNFEYLMEIKNAKLRSDFNELRIGFDKAWYRNNKVDDDYFSEFEKISLKIKKTLL